jgi:hypothetical protein
MQQAMSDSYTRSMLLANSRVPIKRKVVRPLECTSALLPLLCLHFGSYLLGLLNNAQDVTAHDLVNV